MVLEEEHEEHQLHELTGLGNRRHAEMHMQARLDQLSRYSWPLGLLYFDIDFFKRINDTYGHDAGDRVGVLDEQVGGEAPGGVALARK